MNQQRRQGRAYILAVLLIAWACACTGTSPPTDEVEGDLRRAQALTVPQGVGNVEHPTPGVQRSMVVQRVWSFTTTVTWDNYQSWVTEQLRGRFELKTKTETVLDFTKVLPGDFYQLRIERGSSDPPLHVRVTFTAMPD